MQDIDFDNLLSDYRKAIDSWVTAIEAEEALANDDHSMVEMEKWDAAGFSAQDAEASRKKSPRSIQERAAEEKLRVLVWP